MDVVWYGPYGMGMVCQRLVRLLYSGSLKRKLARINFDQEKYGASNVYKGGEGDDVL